MPGEGAVVDDAVAVVVEAVADLGHGHAAVACLQTSVPFTQAVMPAVQVAEVGAAGDADAGQHAVVDLAVAVVVDVVADLLRRRDDGRVAERAGAVGVARQDAAALAGAARRRSCTTSPTSEALVDVAVAVVVEAVADLGRGTAQPQGPPQAFVGQALVDLTPLQLSSLQLQRLDGAVLRAVPLRLSASFGSFERPGTCC